MTTECPQELGAYIKLFNGRAVDATDIGAYPVYGSNGIIGFTNECRHRDSIIIGRVGAYCGSVHRERGSYWASDNAIVADAQEGQSDVDFLYYLLLALPLNSLAGGSAQPLINHTILSRIRTILPDYITQKKIAAILTAYDELIENNQRRIAALEKMAEELYREWFVRLRFPGHEQVKLVKGVPQGWDVKRLGEVLELCYGKALKDDARIPGDIPVYGSSGIVGTHNEALVESPGLIVGRKGNVGSVYWSDCGFYPIDTVYFVKSELPNSFLNFLLRSMNFINNDSAVPGLNRSQAYSNQFYLPTSSLIDSFSEMADRQFKLKSALVKMNEALRQTRDLLLPRLISGKLRVDALDIQFPPSMNATPES